MGIQAAERKTGAIITDHGSDHHQRSGATITSVGSDGHWESGAIITDGERLSPRPKSREVAVWFAGRPVSIRGALTDAPWFECGERAADHAVRCLTSATRNLKCPNPPRPWDRAGESFRGGISASVAVACEDRLREARKLGALGVTLKHNLRLYALM